MTNNQTRRQLILNWSNVLGNEQRNAHSGIERAVKEGFSLLNLSRLNPEQRLQRQIAAKVLSETGRGWSYVTFYPLGTEPNEVVFNLAELEEIARENGYFLPAELVMQHNKVVVTAVNDLNNPAISVYGLYEFLKAYEAAYRDTEKNPHSGFYGKFGGVYERPERGRVLAMYSNSDDGILAIDDAVNELIQQLKIPTISFSHEIRNGLSVLTKLARGAKANGGATHYFVDPHSLQLAISQAREDQYMYLFERPQ